MPLGISLYFSTQYGYQTMPKQLAPKDVTNWLFLALFLDSPPPSPREVRKRAHDKIRHMADYLERSGYPAEVLAEFFSVSGDCRDYEGVAILAAENLADAYFSGYMEGEPCTVH